MQPAPQPDDVLVQNALTKLRLKKRIAEWDQYVEGPVLGEARSRLGCARALRVLRAILSFARRCVSALPCCGCP